MTDRIQHFANDGFTFPVTDAGPIDGQIVVLLHGFPQTSTSWDMVCERLHASGYRTLAFDQRGYAPTARPRGRFSYRISALVGDVAALLAAVGTPVHLVGHDWGAVVAWGTAARHPGLLRTLTAVSVPHSRAFLRSLVSSNQALKSYYMAMFQIPWLPESLLSRYPKLADRALRHSGMDAEALQRVHADIIGTGALRPAINWYRAIPFSSRAYLRKVSVPTTYLWSTSDVALGRRCAELCEQYVTGPFRFDVTDGSHWLPEEAPDLLHDLIVDRIKS
ncbi:alpha/beta fold hydrolase [Mycolicibacterium hodleri]|uniref:Alpha/beta fold hydrolase n=1 Tax=Mycolicibacterium hodleri TaxID=49897 RepID=A0A502DPS2_9MYCO|nr:alpha/beta fold hydrolase [Mycolicibacterium hodleri]TPG27377.1 alpha/beta fold hydrolase [Mycolicibacterium hodleri]